MADMTATERERAMVAAYQAGAKVTAIETEFGVGRSTLYHVLRRSGVTPSRSRRQSDAASGDARLAGLAELIQHQDRLIYEAGEREKAKDKEIEQLRRRIAQLESAAARRKANAG